MNRCFFCPWHVIRDVEGAEVQLLCLPTSMESHGAVSSIHIEVGGVSLSRLTPLISWHSWKTLPANLSSRWRFPASTIVEQTGL